MDDVKRKVASLVKRVVTEEMMDLIDSELGQDPDLGDEQGSWVSCFTVSDLETQIRVKSKSGVSRYFIVKVSEQV